MSDHDHPTDPSDLQPSQVFDRVGGLAAFEALVEAFYRRVEHDQQLRPIYPDDLAPGKRNLTLFLAQYWGGGDVYSRDRGHPRLRMRHAPFAITPAAAQRWAELMSVAIREQGFPADAERLLLDYVAWATPTLVNRFPSAGSGLPISPGDDEGR